ncbi:helix-turn-helix domain-containing protein [Herbidospora sp. NEAU-GS84]|uniref:Helix-turn-helix domain-containing protein n=1 Tax=Herbidospora solisilvae TaxID=2696284 RepID=A0A7C9J7B2_9ACTN|nr:helix-turn-helix domain-containing protein [Herbidospora solisilvae]NAS26506.1 helix-turn-helix domain-containing protein [Herbidospora solisilvae]
MAVESAQTLERGLRLLRLLAETPNGLTPTELAAALNVSRPVVYRLVASLQNEGFARRDAAGRVLLGFGVVKLAQAVQPLLMAAAVPALRRLAEASGATAHLTVAEGGEGLAIAVVEPSWTNLHVAYRTGSRHPLSKGAAGLAILSLREGKPRIQATEGHLQEGARGVAAPITGLEWLEASVGIISFGDLDVSVAGPLVSEAAKELGEALDV